MNDGREKLRPEVATKDSAANPAEVFQNDVLRPIAKMQNALLLEVYRHFLTKRKVPFHRMSKQERLEWIGQSLSKDNRLRGMMLGVIMGQFTPAEMRLFLKVEPEMRRRVIGLITQRLQDQVDLLLG